MKLDEYQLLASRTARSSLTKNELISNFALGIAGEAGETVDIIKKHLYHGHSLDIEKLKGELGDVLWYVGNLAMIVGLSLDNIAITNIEKLKARYPEGFSEERSYH